MPRDRKLTIRVDERERHQLLLDARRNGRPLSAHLRAKIFEPADTVEERLEKLERKSLFVALAMKKLFVGFELEKHIAPLMDALDNPHDPFEMSDEYDQSESF
ncbi:MAG: hypothetical protein AAF668_16925 [Pseudomonadota bacterium]